jgi:hypothetical protein
MNNCCIFCFHAYINEIHGSKSKIPIKNLVRQRCAEGFNCGVKSLIYHSELFLFQRPRDLRRGSVATRLLDLRVRIPSGYTDVCFCECCLLLGKGFVTGQSLVQGSPTECGVPEYDLETSTEGRPSPSMTVEPWKKLLTISIYLLN